ncbi:MAG: ABC transporter ATP-binding protein [Acidilobus sp.]
MIHAEGLVKRFGATTAVQDVTFTVNNGEIVCLVGLNGAGKTTTIRMIAGVLRPDSGKVTVDGYDVVRQKVEASRRVGWVPELPAFEEHFKARDYFIYLAGYYGIPEKEARKMADRLLDEVGLSDAKDRALKDFSHGMRKRFALSVSMISDPQNYLFDEVLNGLDPQGIVFFREFALRLKKEGRAVLFSSHILSEVQNLADRVVFLHRGNVIVVKSMDEIIDDAREGVRVTVLNPDGRVASVLGRLGEVKRAGERTFLVRGAQPQDVSSTLVREGYQVAEVVQLGGLEEYFFRLIGERK